VVSDGVEGESEQTKSRATPVIDVMRLCSPPPAVRAIVAAGASALPPISPIAP